MNEFVTPQFLAWALLISAAVAVVIRASEQIKKQKDFDQKIEEIVKPYPTYEPDEWQSLRFQVERARRDFDA